MSGRRIILGRCPTVPAVLTWALLPLLLWGPLRPCARDSKPPERPQPRKVRAVWPEDGIFEVAPKDNLRYRPGSGPQRPHPEPLYQPSLHPRPPVVAPSPTPAAPFPSAGSHLACAVQPAAVASAPAQWRPAATSCPVQASLPLLFHLLEDAEAQGRHLLVNSFLDGFQQLQNCFATILESIQSKAAAEPWVSLEALPATPPPLRRRSDGRRNSLLLTPQRCSSNVRYLPYAKKAPDTPGRPRQSDSCRLAELQMSVRFILSDAEATSRAALSSRAQTEQACLAAQLQLLQQWEASIRAITREQEVAELQHLAAAAAVRCASAPWPSPSAVDGLLHGMARNVAYSPPAGKCTAAASVLEPVEGSRGAAGGHGPGQLRRGGAAGPGAAVRPPALVPRPVGGRPA
eukprot:EG_transcript_9132